MPLSESIRNSAESASQGWADDVADLESQVEQLTRERDEAKQQLEAERKKCEAMRKVINKHYPSIAGGCIQLKEAVEDNAAREWNGICGRYR